MLIGVGANCIRNYFLTIHPTWGNKPSDALALQKGVLKLHPLEEAEFNTGNIESWDVSLLVSVLQYTLVSAVELKRNPDIKNALCKVQEIRNRIVAHAKNEKIDDTKFQFFWEELKRNLLVLGAKEADIDETLIGKVLLCMV